VLECEAAAGRGILLVHGDVACDAAREQRELDLPTPRAAKRHALRVLLRGQARLPLDPLRERRSVEF
jgi:hypothetical protein